MSSLSNIICLEKRKRKHRAVSVVIGTLMIVAITVVAATIIFTFTEGYYGQAQISGTQNVEFVKFIGYDARDVTELYDHNGSVMAVGTAGDPASTGKVVDERVAVYIQNHSTNEILLKEIRFGGYEYSYHTSILPLGAWDDTLNLVPGKYFILQDSTTILQEPIPIVQPGEAVTILIDLDENFPINRDIQFKLKTMKGSTFMDTIVIGNSDLLFFGNI
jgi:archaeal type IV pilus assembly protein PilA